MMTCARFDQQLDAWLDGILEPAAAGEMDRHLASCDACRADADGMRAVLRAAAALPTSIAPPRSLWPGIAARLGDPATVALQPRRPWRRWLTLAAAAALLVGVTATVTWQLAREPVAIANGTGPAVARTAGFSADHEFVVAAADLERMLEEERDRLAPETVAVLERNLALIDAAITEARAALAADPANRDLRALLWGAHRQKLDLLERATRLTRS